MTPEEAYYKCFGNDKRDKDLELIIIKSSEFAYNYSLNIIKGRWIEAEKYIIKDLHYAYFYANHIIEGRWIEAEQYIIKDSCYAYFYALNVIKGKLPENMHNAMILYAVNADKYAKNYFKLIKNNTQP